ncbi:MAG: hypothetical protein A3F76_08270 [Burkholderiales bacterium RIFCSPLOWO2_12_FULL_65_40]|nr:MAG: hypothetical protein A3F76_08270 [Burkholderiales bacterium RIFCSPLOWO2_12_FULL_65_40]
MRPILTIVPCAVKDANALVDRLHRHHAPTVGGLFAVAVEDEHGVARGAAIVGRPVSRMLDDGWTCEVTRVATDGCDNACSALYGAALRGAKAIGYTAILTYTLPSEGGASLRGAGWVLDLGGEYGGGEWSVPSRERKPSAVPGVKHRWWAPGSCIPAHAMPTRGICREDDDAQARLFGGAA